MLWSCTGPSNVKQNLVCCLSDSLKVYNVDSINNVWPEFIGRFKPGESIKKQSYDSIDYSGVEIDDGLSRLDKISNATEGFRVVSYPDTCMQSDYPQFQDFWHYPVYVVNESNASRYFTLKDDYVLALQEALHPNGNWYPIEKRGPDGCWNGSWSIYVEPKEFLVFLVNKYNGNFKTKIRVRLNIGRSIYYSDPFDGYINMEQFFLRNEALKEAFKTNKDFMVDFWFNGATPLQAQTHF